jgi:Macrocin-O-methyltransferase (TylF)
MTGWKAKLKRCIPGPILNRVLLSFPSLYDSSLVNFESNLDSPGLDDLLDCLEEASRLPGNLIELGSSRAGTAIILARWLRARRIPKIVYACDSFQGFDLKELRQERALSLSNPKEDAHASTSFEYVSKKLQRLGVSETVKPIQGYFQETLPRLQGSYCLALVDCDLKESMTFCARWVFERLVVGGWMAFDDYVSEDYRGAKLAVDEFVGEFRERLTIFGVRRRLYFVRKDA